MADTQRKQLPTHTGVVASISGKQTVRVVMSYLTRHPKYGKMLKRRIVAHVHDQDNIAKVGDSVEIVKCRPMSKTKHWRLSKVLNVS